MRSWRSSSSFAVKHGMTPLFLRLQLAGDPFVTASVADKAAGGMVPL